MSRLMNQDTITWVMCSSMLPEEDGLYLVTCCSTHTDNCFVGTSWLCEGKWIATNEHMGLFPKIISWAKLPEPFTGV